jgi:hypothetical protein
VVVFALNDHEYLRWLDLEAQERRSRAEEVELAGYLKAIAEAEAQIRQAVAEYLQTHYEWHCRHDCGAERAEIYRTVAPAVPPEWGARRVARVHGEIRHADDVFAGKMLLLDEALLALCGAGRVEALRDPAGDTTFRWSADPEATRRRHEQELARASQPRGRRKKSPASGGQRPGGDAHAATTARTDLRTLLAALGGFVGFDE